MKKLLSFVTMLLLVNLSYFAQEIEIPHEKFEKAEYYKKYEAHILKAIEFH